MIPAFDFSADPLEVKAAPWLPEVLRRRFAVIQGSPVAIRSRFLKSEKRIFLKREQIPVSQWAERHRVITMGALPGRWRNSVTPYLAGVMDASLFPSVQTLILCAAQQTGKSESVHNCIGYAIDRNPGPVLYVYPDEKTARENSRDRIQPMINSSPQLRSYLTGYRDDATTMQINLEHMPIYLGWARSPATMANKPIKNLVLDEIDLFPETAAKNQPDSISYAEKRTRTYRWSRKIWKISSPTVESGAVWQALTTEAQVRFDYWVCCPDCGQLHHMEFEQVKWPKDQRDPEQVESLSLAWYECPLCGGKWDERKRDMAVRCGRWQDSESGMALSEYLETYRPLKVGFHIPAWLSYFVSFSECAAAFLKGLKNKTKLKDFQNAYAAKPWKEYTEVRTEDAVLALKDHRPRGLVPGGGVVAGLIGSADTQDNGFYYEIRAWGHGLEEESWQIREGFALTFSALEQILFSDEYFDAAGNLYKVAFSCIDAMGHRTKEVYNWCRKHRGRVLPLQGVDRQNQPVSYTKIDVFPGTNKQIKGGLKLMRVNVNYFKSYLSNKLEVAPTDPGAWHLHSEATVEWARQMTSEYPDEKTGLWVAKPGAANHAWDVAVYNCAAAEAVGVKFWKRKEHRKSNERGTRRVISSGVRVTS